MIFAIQLTDFEENPNEMHWIPVKIIFLYLTGAVHAKELEFVQLYNFEDVDCAED